MATFNEVDVLDKVEIVNLETFPMIQCRHAQYVTKDGEIVGGKTFHRHVIAPDSDVSNEPQEVQALAAAVHTQAVKDAYAAHLAEQEAEMNPEPVEETE